MQKYVANIHRVVQKANNEQSKLGRRPEFDRSEVVESAIQAFWAKGFAATTLGDLEEATGVDRSTIYNSFGGKTGLYQSATAAYVDLSEELLFEPLNSGTAGIADIVEFLDRLAFTLDISANPQGCLIVNDMAGEGDHDATGRYLESLEHGLGNALDRAAGLGETDLVKNAQRCQFLTAAILGVNIIDRNVADADRAQALIGGLRSEVASWADPDHPLA